MTSPRDERTRPCVVVCVARGLEEARCEIEAGLEEEGIPFLSRWIEPCQPAHGRTSLAFTAASESRLGVGLAVDAQGACLHMHKLPSGQPMLERTGANARLWRLFGQDAARLVKGLPLLTPNEPSEVELNRINIHERNDP